MRRILFFLSFMIANLCVNASSFNDSYETTIVFPANYQVGDYIEFVKASPINAGASGYYEISISYTRGNVAAASTHLASISHANPNVWREVGRVNGNGYIHNGYSFTVDCNTEYVNPRFRIRAVAVSGVTTQPIGINIKISSININGDWTLLNSTGNDLTVDKFLPMTNDWSLYVGNPIDVDGASIAIKALENGNVGIGTIDTKGYKLAVAGKMIAESVKVQLQGYWSDFVFAKDYKLPSLQETEKHIKENGHLPGIPSAAEVKINGIDLGEINAKLLQKIEELTLYLIEQQKTIQSQNKALEMMKLDISKLKNK